MLLFTTDTIRAPRLFCRKVYTVNLIYLTHAKLIQVYGGCTIFGNLYFLDILFHMDCKQFL